MPPTGHGQAARASAEKGPVEAESWTLAEARRQSFAHLPAWQVEGSDAEEGNGQNMPEQPPHLWVAWWGRGLRGPSDPRLHSRPPWMQGLGLGSPEGEVGNGKRTEPVAALLGLLRASPLLV